MSAGVYELLLRHDELLDASTVIIGSESSLPSGWITKLRERQCHLLSWNWLTVEAHRPLEAPQIQFGIPELNASHATRAIILWPKSKPLALALLRLVAHHIDECWLVGANDTGGKSIGKACTDWVENIEKVDSARHCTLWQATLIKQPALNWLTLAQSFHFNNRAYMTLPGVFNHGSLDVGTRVLLEHLPPPSRGKLLDLGCGSGVIGLSMKAAQAKLNVTLADVDAFALRSAQLNCARLGLEATIIASNGLSNIEGRFDYILSNPPFHQGKETDYQFARQLFQEASRHLVNDGQLWIVANRHLAYEDWALQYFHDVQLLAIEKGFKLLCISQPKGAS